MKALESRDALEGLVAEAAIRRVINRYAVAIDDRDDAKLLSCFHSDSTHSHGAFTGLSSEFCRLAMDIVRTCSVTQHILGTIDIEVERGSASCRTYFWAYHKLDPLKAPIFEGARPGDHVYIGGRYTDRFEKRQEEWRIANRHGVRDWWHFASGAETPNELMIRMSAPLRQQGGPTLE